MSVTINNIKVDFNNSPRPRITFLQGANMEIQNIRDTLREIEESVEGRMFDTFLTRNKGIIVRADGNYPYGQQITALDITILDPFEVAFEAGATPFVAELGSLLIANFVDSPGAIVNIYQAKGALVVSASGTSADEIWSHPNAFNKQTANSRQPENL